MTILETAPIMGYAHAHLWMVWVGLGIAVLGFTFAYLNDKIDCKILFNIFLLSLS